MWSQTAGAGWFVFKDVASTVLEEVWCVSKVLGLTELDIWLNLSRMASVSKPRELLQCLPYIKAAICIMLRSILSLH